MHTAGSQAKAPARTCLELLEDNLKRVPIGTRCSALDDLLGGGLQLGEITELCGQPGIGKTQISIQLALNARFVELEAGAFAHSVFIDTEGAFMIERVVQIAEAMLRNSEAAHTRDIAEILSGIHYFRAQDHIELVALVKTLPQFLATHQGVKIIVCDSIAAHFRHDFEDMATRTRILGGLAQDLALVADRHKLAVLLTYHVTTKSTESESRLVPALGDSWAHHCNTRLLCFWKDGERHANLMKSAFQPNATIPYTVTEDGVRDSSAKRPLAAIEL